MIKKTLLSFIFGLTLLPAFSFAGDFYLNIPATITDSINENILTFIPSNNFIVNSQYQVFQVKGRGTYPRLQTVFWSNTGLYIISSCAGGYGCQNIHTSIQKQGYLTKYCKTTYGNVCYNKNLNVSDFYSTDSYKTADYLYIKTSGGDLQYFDFCFNYQSLNESICFSVDEATNIYSNSKGFTYNPYISELGSSVDQISSYFTQSPFTPSINPNIPITGGVDIGGYDYIPVHTGNYISYFEDKGFNIDMCYVGTKDLSGLYEDRITYNQGTGYTIFDTYSKLFNTNSFKLSDIGIFLNYWLIDYDTWFLGKNRYVDGTPYYNMIYNSPSNYYVDKGPNLTNIFLGNKAVYFFLASSIRDRIDELNIGDDTALYCYYKLTRYANVSNDGGSYNITDDHSDTTDTLVALYVRNKINDIDGISLSGANVINSQSWDGSVLDNFSGDTYTDFSSFFSNNFNKYKTFFSQYDISDLALGQLPSYIVGFMLMLIFFRFLSH